jgi:ABC-type transporter lipoprotein component MlaA
MFEVFLTNVAQGGKNKCMAVNKPYKVLKNSLDGYCLCRKLYSSINRSIIKLNKQK